MTAAKYRNYRHYLREGWSQEPKESFVALAALLKQAAPPERAALLDVGCATGELIHFLSTQFPGFTFSGVDVFDELLTTARERLPQAEFAKASALELPARFEGRFDLVTAMGVFSIFDDTELAPFLDNLLRVVRPGGRVLLLGPLNEYGVDCVIRHRKRTDGEPGPWEGGWNIHSRQTLAETLEGRCRRWQLHDFQIGSDLEPRPDPVRTWTIRTDANPRQLTNGLKLLIDLYFVEIER